MSKAIGDEIAIKVTDLTLTYRTTTSRSQSLKKVLMRAGRGGKRTKVIEAIKDLSFTIHHGTILGVVGHNGAGKSTLLRAISGIMPPTTGEVEVHGEINALLSLQSGFNKDLTGRENVTLSGLAAGMTRAEIDQQMDAIVAFAELEEFIDMPVDAYSSGMGQRLAFAAAVHTKPDILLVDEALSAGDARFKIKAQRRMEELMNQARTLVVVSHSINTVREMCNQVLWIDHGRMMAFGDTDEVINRYMEFMNVGTQSAALEDF